MKKTSVLFICMGNICRSPSADGIFRHRLAEAGLSDLIEVDSAGTHGYHIGHAPDARTQAAAERRGYDLSALRARRVERGDFARFEWIVAMDNANVAELMADCPAEHRHKIVRLMDFATRHDAEEVPDPYYGGAQGFETVLDYIEDGIDGLLRRLRQGA
ncbi:low molecular weight protein-tyrosine-phosphatase [Pandoraea pnomenusa]|jgi:protein-tyrosine phosphatase|nr:MULTISPECIES: low molecular weight protein-tyrosine-phosphatase [Pandoraea]AHB06576.1 phosphotyrosine protein phosphatase [Pandoraea pnomenusa 3kgm]AHB77363.1 phosphotyrosine protein phosphatase [Pandoraea pnomenusa]AHN74298.1 phosphotyrosine protein phosphatase [Pandoraea pnomenusa]ANC46088.1 phosphotyrosine protein phosphatase [Pandoraea pnomenusa]MBN9095096.1 low molecular weight phosphotyrosine protein phosphatase [Pandoraea pnomenusa]